MKRCLASRTVCASLIGLALALGTPRLPAVIVITEIMYHPAGGGQDLEYIEIHNESPDPVDITNYSFSDGVSFTFIDRKILSPGEYLVVCANAAKVKQTYGIQNAIGDWDPTTSLSNGGERISLVNPGGAIEATVRYNDRGKWPSGADGTGHSLELEDPYLELDDPDHWALSGVLGGSPGEPNDTATGRMPIFVNEAYLIPTAGERWVELYNGGDSEVDLSGYRITAERSATPNAVLPPGTTIGPRSRASFTDTELGLSFAPRLTADVPPLLRTFIALWNPDGTRVIDAREFEPVEGLSEARLPDGDAIFSSAADPTRDAANKATVVTDIVINEVMYHPWDNDPGGEYVELTNRGEEPVDLGGWSFSNGVNFLIPPGTLLPAGAYLVVARDPERIREVYGLPATQVIGPTTDEAREAFGVMADRGERITLSDPSGNIADTVRFHDGGEWPRWPDGGGSSMELIDPFQDNAVAQAWDSSDESAKSQAREYAYVGNYWGSGVDPEFHLVLPGAGIVVVDDLEMVQETIALEVSSTIVDYPETWRYLKGLAEPPADWKDPGFDDAAWASGPAPFGFGYRDEGVLLEDMRGSYISFYIRKEFTVADPSQLGGLFLEVEYDDGYIAYLNGTEVSLGNMDPELRSFEDRAQGNREKEQGRTDLTDRKDLLVPGKNVLAVQVHNSSLTNSDVRFQARVVEGQLVVEKSPNFFRNGAFDDDSYKSSWVIQGTHYRSGRTAVEPLSGAGSFKIISTGGGENKVNRIETSNTGLTAKPALRADYMIRFLARWIAGSPTLLTHGEYSTAVSSPPSYARSHRLEIPAQLGTPGAPNSVTLQRIAATGSSNLGPVIDKVSIDPALPAASTPVHVRARVHDPDGVSGVRLLYSLNTPAAPGTAGLTELSMAGPDPDGYYSSEIPGQTLRTRVVFHIEATDSKGNDGRYPLDFANRTHPLLLDPESPSVNDHLYLIYRHDNPVAGRQHSYRFWMHQANESYLGSRPLLSNDLVDGSFIFQNRVLYTNAKIRFSGSPWARQAWSESYRVRMPRDNPLHGHIESFNLEDHQRGGALSALERISHYLIRWNTGPAKLPYSLQWLVRFQVNDRLNNEIREHTQTPNREFIRRWYAGEDDGDFFEVDDRFVINDGGSRENSNDAHVRYPPYPPHNDVRGQDKEEYRYFFNLRAREDLDDYTRLIEMAKVLTAGVTSDEDFSKRIWEVWNVEQLLGMWAIRLNTDDWDTWGANRGKNCYFYRPSIDGPWVDIPWDMELTYTETNSGSVGSFMPPTINATQNPPPDITFGIFPEALRILNEPSIKRRYYGIMAEMLDRQFNSAFLAPWVAQLDAIGLVNTDRAKPGGWIDRRANALRAAVKGVSSKRTPPLAFSVTTNGGNPIAVEAESPPAAVTIEGTAPVEVAWITALVDGKLPEPPWTVAFAQTTLTSWSATGLLELGTHRIEFIGTNGYDDLLGSVSIQVTVSSAGPPSVTSVEPSQVAEDETVTVRGTNFLPGSTVLFGTIEAAPIEFVGTTELRATVPAGLELGPTELRVRNPSALESDPYPIEVVAGKPRFLRGDADMDGEVLLTDAIVTLDWLFRGGMEPVCLDAADSDDTGEIDLTDAIYTLSALFTGGDEIPPPYPDPGPDPTDTDELDCGAPLP